MPTYIVAYAYLDILHPIGPVQSALRALLGVDQPADLRLPDIRSMGGAIFLLGFVLYPYVYLSTRALFLMQAIGPRRSGADARRRAAGGVLPGRAAARPAGDRRRHDASR